MLLYAVVACDNCIPVNGMRLFHDLLVAILEFILTK